MGNSQKYKLFISSGSRARHNGEVKKDASLSPLISVITVVRNGEATLEKTIQSVLNQSYKNIEYIVIDGDSVDSTVEIILKYSEEISYWESAPDRGIYDAMNKAVKLARGEWIYFLGSDDVLLDSLKYVARNLKDENAIYYGNVILSSSGLEYDGEFSVRKLTTKNICQQAIFYPRKVFHDKVFNLKYPVLADYEFNLRCVGDKKYEFVYMPVTVAVYNDISGVSKEVVDESFSRDAKRIIRNNITWLAYSGALVWRTCLYFVNCVDALRKLIINK